jgi:phage terminase large subunit
MEIVWDLFEHQDDFFFSDALHNGLVGGYGCGKSQAGVIKTIHKKLMLGPDIPVAYYLPTYGLIRDVAYPKFKALFIEKGIPFTLNKSEHDFTTPYGKIHLRSMNNPDNIVGYEVGYSLIDETDILPKKKMDEVFDKIIGRNRLQLPDGLKNITDVVGTPEGFKWFYNFFVKNATPDRVLTRGKTEDNYFLSDTYVDTLKKVYSPEQLRAYLKGEFVNLTSGSVYSQFDRDINNTNRKIQPGEHLHIGMDFNVTNMNATVAVKEGFNTFTCAEFSKIYDTFDMIKAIKERFGAAHSKITIYPDASGKNRKTSSKYSDHQLLKDAGFEVKAKPANPFVKDRVNSVNSGFMNKKSYINIDECPTLCEALENITWDDNGEPDKNSGYDHITEAYGYKIHYLDNNKLISGKGSY